MSAPFHKLDNLTAIVDRNHIQNDDFVEATTALEPLAKKWHGFGWHVEECDGHDVAAVLDALEKVRQVKDQPQVIIAHTIKGKGVSYMENNPAFHGRAPNKEEYAQAMKELGF
jgi:transketolase